MTAMRAALMRHVDMNTSLQSSLREVKEQLAGSDRRMTEMTAREVQAKDELIRLRKENEVLRKENQGTRATLATRDSKLMELRGLAAEHLSRLEQSLKLLDAAAGKTKAAEGWATAAENRASAAEQQVSVLQEELSVTRGECSTTREELTATRGELTATREELTRAVEAAAGAVEAYKDSDQFGIDAAVACVSLYEFGYTDCLTKVKEAHPSFDLSRLAYAAEDEEEEEGEVLGDNAGAAPGTGPGEGQGALKDEGALAAGLPSTGAPGENNAERGEGPGKGGPPDSSSRNNDSGGNASEPIVVESPEPDRGQEPPVKEVLQPL